VSLEPSPLGRRRHREHAVIINTELGASDGGEDGAVVLLDGNRGDLNERRPLSLAMPGHLQLQINAPAAPDECLAVGGLGVRALALYMVVELPGFCTEKVVICAASSGDKRCSWAMS
jgi:hypothetical protein